MSAAESGRVGQPQGCQAVGLIVSIGELHREEMLCSTPQTSYQVPGVSEHANAFTTHRTSSSVGANDLSFGR